MVLTRDEISGLTSGLLVSHDPPLGKLAFSAWLAEHADQIGRRYANELDATSPSPEPPGAGGLLPNTPIDAAISHSARTTGVRRR